MAQETGKTADKNAVEVAVGVLVEETGQTEQRVGHDVVAEDGLPADNEAAALQKLQEAVYEAGQQAGTEAPAGAVQEYRQHADVNGTALRQLKELDEAQHIRQSDHDGALAERAELEMRFGFHVSFLLNCDFVIWGSRI